MSDVFSEEFTELNNKLNGIILELKQEIIILRESRDYWKKEYLKEITRKRPFKNFEGDLV